MNKSTGSAVCFEARISESVRKNPKKNKASFSQSQIVYFHMLFRQPFPVVIILPNSFKCLFNGEPSPLSGAGGAAFTSLHAPFCFLPSDRKPSILPLTDLDCTSEWHQTMAGDRQRPCPAPRLWVWGAKNSRANLQQRRP